MEIKWFEKRGSVPEKKRSLIENWLKDNADEIHDIYHLVQEYTMEVVKIIDGKQENCNDGKIKITSYDLYVVSEAILIVNSEEIQSPEKMESSRSMKYLAEVEIPCDEYRVD